MWVCVQLGKGLKSIMEQAFDHFGKVVLYEEQLFKYGGMNIKGNKNELKAPEVIN